MTEIRLVYCTFPSADQAQLVAEDLVSSGLAACVNLGQPVLSVYQWEGKLCREQEVQATFKTTSSALEALYARVRELHSYDCPELLAVPVAGGSEDYVSWVQEQVRSS
jgi:periplasmic divalent cation tolerance protein